MCDSYSSGLYNQEFEAATFPTNPTLIQESCNRIPLSTNRRSTSEATPLTVTNQN